MSCSFPTWQPESGDSGQAASAAPVMSDVAPPRFLPLVALANVLTVLLGVVLAAIALRLVVAGLGAGSEHWRHDFIDLGLDKAVNSLGLAVGIVFVMWFRRARINAGRSGWPQRRSTGWTFWGWIVPIVSLWFPFQIMGDIWRAGLPESKRNKVAWLPTVWWTTWLLGTVITPSDSGWPDDFGLDLTGRTWTWSLWVVLVSGAALLIIIRRVSCGPVGQAR